MRKTLFYPAVLLFIFPAGAMASDGGSSAEQMIHRMMLLAIQLGVIIFAARMGNILFERLRLPGPLGELLAGIIIGPYCLGQLAFYGFGQGVFPLYAGMAVSPELYGLRTIAAIILMFTVGLETDIGLMLRYSLTGGLVGAGGIVVAFAAGAGVVMLFGNSLLGLDVGFMAPESLMLGVILTATSVGLTARILSEKRKLHSPEGVTILSAAIIDDVIGIILLAVVMTIAAAPGGAAGMDWGHVGIVALKAITVWLAATAIGLLASRKISFLLKWFGEQTSIAIMAFALALILAGLFEEAGLAMIIGAYVMGLSLSKTDISHVVREKLHPVHQLLVPVFFCVTGMQIDLGVFASPAVLVFGLIFAAAALGSKVIGCGGPAMFANFNLRGAGRIGFGMAPRCEVALLIAGTALFKGLIDGQLFAAVIVMILVNTIVAPMALTMLYRKDVSGLRKPAPERKAGRESLTFEFPSMEMAEFLAGKLTGVFESEGFFVHLIDRRKRHYQCRKDDVIIDLQRDGTNLSIDCRRIDTPLVNTAMCEALAALEQTIQGLRKPMDALAITTRLMDETAPAPQRRFNLGNYITPSLIESNLKADTKVAVIDELLDILRRNDLLKDVDEARRAVWAREQGMSTGLQHGVAIPHGKTDAVDRLVCAIGIKKEGVDFDALDGKPSGIFVLTLSPINKPAPHVQFMSAVSQILNAAGRESILSSRTSRQLCNIFVSREIRRPRPAFRKKSKPEPAKISLREYIQPELLQPNLKGTTKDEIIGELLDILQDSGRLGDVETARKAISDREQQMSTGMDKGIAIPHGRTDAVDKLICAIGVKREGVDFGSADGLPTKVIIMMLTPKDAADPHLRFMAEIIGLLDAGGMEKVLAAKTREQLYEVLVGRDESGRPGRSKA